MYTISSVVIKRQCKHFTTIVASTGLKQLNWRMTDGHRRRLMEPVKTVAMEANAIPEIFEKYCYGNLASHTSNVEKHSFFSPCSNLKVRSSERKSPTSSIEADRVS